MPPATPPPPRGVPVLYFAFGHLMLLAALAVVAIDPRDLAGFFYHPPMFGVVHLVTLGWITLSILGSTYLVATFALRMQLPATRLDGWVAAGAIVGASGVFSHFFLNGYWGVASSGALLLLALLPLAWKVLRALRASKAPPAVRLHIALAWVNLLLAITYGILLAVNRKIPFLPGTQIHSVFGHVHLAAIGWAGMMVVGVGYRLFSMYLPAAPPEGPSVWASAVLLEAGVLGLATCFLMGSPWTRLFAPVVVAGLLVFLFNIARMRRHPKPPPPQMPRPDIGMLLALQALAYLLVCAGLGLYLLFTDEWHLSAIMVYGAFGLLGVFGQIIVGMQMRMLPMFAWTEAWHRSGFREVPPPPWALPSRPLQWGAFAGWTAGVPLLAAGLALDRLPVISAGGWSLLLGTLSATASNLLVLRHAWRSKPPSPAPV